MITPRILSATLALTLAGSLSAVTHTVNNATDFNNLPSLNAGDIVVMNSGTYGAINKTIVSNIADDATAQTNPITIYAATNGGVDINAPSQITLQGRGIILAGLDFVAGSGMYNNGSADPAWIIRTAANSRYIAISNIRFLNCVSGDDYGHWLYLEGFNHTIEYCSFEGKSTRNATVAFKRSTSEAGITTLRNHRLRYCYFGPRECSTTENGFETIRIGDSSSQAHDMNVTIEQNVFYRAIWRNDGQKPNDMEIISNKTKGNKIINNTFLESYGQLTLRHGDACTVDGNYIIGGGYYSGSSILLRAANSHQTGIRVIGQDHIIRNNYLINLIGTNLRAALCVMGGDSGFSDGNGSGGSNGYEAAHNAQVYNNTFIDCKELHLGYLNGSSTVQPTGVKVYNNAWQGSGTSNGIVRNSSFNHGGSAGNYIYHPSGSYGWTGLGGTYSSTISPAITESFDNYLIPTSSSPLLNVANTTLVASNDVRNLTRPSSNKDIGSFEREVAGSGLKPLLKNQVGPEFDGGPAGTYPDPGSTGTAPTITTTSLPNGTVGVAYSQTLQATGGDGTLTWSVVSGSLPTSLSLSSAGVISGTPTVNQTSNFTVQVADIDNDTDTQALTIVVDPSGTVATPTYNPVAGTYATAQSVTISTTTSGATIRYTTDGTNPSQTVGTVYSTPVNIAATTTLKAIAYKSGMSDSAIASGTYTITGGGGTGAFIMSGNQVVMEAENANSRTSGGGKSWNNVTESGASGAGSNNAIQALPNTGTTASAPGTSTCRADYQIVVPAGAASSFHVHIRARGPSGSDDSIFISVNGSTSSYQQFNTTSSLGWKKANNTISLPVGTQSLTIWMREDGTIVDKIVVSSSSTLPTGTGPAESPRQ